MKWTPNAEDPGSVQPRGPNLQGFALARDLVEKHHDRAGDCLGEAGITMPKLGRGCFGGTPHVTALPRGQVTHQSVDPKPQVGDGRRDLALLLLSRVK